MVGTANASSKVYDVATIEDRLALISRQVDLGSSGDDSWYIRKVALEMVRGTHQLPGAEGEKQEIATVYWAVKNDIEYRQDPEGYDLYASAKRTLESRSGDCDCHTILVASIMKQLGYKVGAKVVSPDGINWHIYAIVAYPRNNPQGYVAMDTTAYSSGPSWEPDMKYRQKEVKADFHTGGGYEIK